MGSYEAKAKIYGVKCATSRQSGNLVRCSVGHGDSNGHSPKSPRQAPHFRFIGRFIKLEPSHITPIYFFQAVCRAPWSGLYSKSLLLSILSFALRTSYRLYTLWVNKNSFIFCPRNFFQPQKILSWKNSVIVTIEVKLQSH